MRRGLIATAAGVVLVGAGGAAAVGFGGTGGAGPAVAPAAPAAAPVMRGTLTQTEEVNGTLGYGDGRTVSARGGGGTITWLPAAGATINRGGAVYRADQVTVPLIYGTLPLYRPLATGVEGADVAELERNLSALGYGGFTVDDSYTSATAAAVKSWQKDLGADQTGVVTPGSVVVAPAAI